MRSALVVTQLAVSLLLLVGAGLVLRSLKASRTADAGFDPHHVVSLSVDLQPNGYDETRGPCLPARSEKSVSGAGSHAAPL